mmetsp:Transcript_17234/g.42747  ORF Transcript_17234/g.42747 Transcript_17234/m.42747 type:complete len:169 (+) Transcript_17234:98-604(+)|eukprot:CAMPEP_0178997386 /NCGR_PEP_ID=MMETSP0795-20121207/8893_1 /TAXON_ID=88552 /ORGANISM="Amoebophrya sp., Strain Ameob2" /LENGTH=168 /DNA_ID=CAMNT_0020689877 /DNA_START=42 /DNA_END=548 /DNA_ORIENTATION=+
MPQQQQPSAGGGPSPPLDALAEALKSLQLGDDHAGGGSKTMLELLERELLAASSGGIQSVRNLEQEKKEEDDFDAMLVREIAAGSAGTLVGSIPGRKEEGGGKKMEQGAPAGDSSAAEFATESLEKATESLKKATENLLKKQDDAFTAELERMIADDLAGDKGITGDQ